MHILAGQTAKDRHEATAMTEAEALSATERQTRGPRAPLEEGLLLLRRVAEVTEPARLAGARRRGSRRRTMAVYTIQHVTCALASQAVGEVQCAVLRKRNWG